MEKEKLITALYMDSELLNHADRIAEKLDVSRSELICMLINAIRDPAILKKAVDMWFDYKKIDMKKRL